MPFSPIVVNTKTFNQAGDGRYLLSTVSFGSPLEYLQIKGGSLTKDRQNIVWTVSKVLQKDVTVNGVTERRQSSLQLICTSPVTGFTTAEFDAGASDISEFLTTSTLNRLFAGES